MCSNELKKRERKKPLAPLMITTLDELCPAYFSCCYWIQAFETFCLYLYCSHYCVWSLIITVTYSVQFVIVQMMKWICSNKHLKWWQKPQVLQWLSSLISNHFSYPNQRCLLHPCFFFLPCKSSNEHWDGAPNFQNKPHRASSTRKKNEKERHDCWKRRRKDKFLYCEVRTKRHADVFSSFSFPGDRYVRVLKALAV